MIKQQSFPHRLLQSVSPEMLAQMHIFDDVAGDEFDWDETSGCYDSDAASGFLASDLDD